MGEPIVLTSADGHRLGAWQAAPRGAAAKGGVVVIHEIFGLNDYIRAVTDRFAAKGYAAIAPSLFDRVRPGFAEPYTREGSQAGRSARSAVSQEMAMADVEAAIAALRPTGSVAVLGFCYGGVIAWLAASGLPIDAAVVYYGAAHRHLDRPPGCPVMIHYAETDHTVSAADREAMRSTYPDLPIHLYPGTQHGFCCDDPGRGLYDRDAEALSFARTLAFLDRHLVGTTPAEG